MPTSWTSFVLVVVTALLRRASRLRGAAHRAAPAQRRRLVVHWRARRHRAGSDPGRDTGGWTPRLTGGHLLALGCSCPGLRPMTGCRTYLAAGLSGVVRADVYRAGARHAGRAPVVACQSDTCGIGRFRRASLNHARPAGARHVGRAGSRASGAGQACWRGGQRSDAPVGRGAGAGPAAAWRRRWSAHECPG